jgi:hypothetical protein
VDEGFEFVRYAERLAASQPSFDALASALAEPPNLIDTTLERLALQAVEHHQPTLVLLSVPFPGSVYAAFRIAQCIKRAHPHIRIGLGGGLCQHRAARAERRARVRPCGFRHAGWR